MVHIETPQINGTLIQRFFKSLNFFCSPCGSIEWAACANPLKRTCLLQPWQSFSLEREVETRTDKQASQSLSSNECVSPTPLMQGEQKCLVNPKQSKAFLRRKKAAKLQTPKKSGFVRMSFYQLDFVARDNSSPSSNSWRPEPVTLNFQNFYNETPTSLFGWYKSLPKFVSSVDPNGQEVFIKLFIIVQ